MTHPSRPPASFSASVPRLPRILFVDDEPSVLRIWRRIAGHHGVPWQPIMASSGKEAMAFHEELGFDVAVVDLNMPQIDGLTLASTLRERQPALVIVAHTGDPERLEGREPGRPFDRVLPKPALTAQMLETLDQALALAHLRGALADGPMRRRTAG